MAVERAELRSGLASHNGTKSTSSLTNLLAIVHFNYPWVILVIFLTAFISQSVSEIKASSKSIKLPVLLGPGGKPLPQSAKKIKAAQEKQKKTDFSPLRKLVFIWLSTAIILSYVANAVCVVIHALANTEINGTGWWCGEPTAIYITGSALFYVLFLLSLVDSSPAPNVAHLVTWVCGLVGEVVILVAAFELYTSPHEEFNSLEDGQKKVHKKATDWEIIELTIATARLILFIVVIGCYAVFSMELSYKNKDPTLVGDVNERAPLLVNGRANSDDEAAGNGSITPANGRTELLASSRSSQNGAVIEGNGHAREGTGTRDIPVDGHKSPDEPPAFYKPKEVPSLAWWEYLRGYSLFFPYLWPAKILKLKIIVMICIGLSVLQRLVNVAVPAQIGLVSDMLFAETPEGEYKKMPWLAISILIILKFLQGTSGILGAARSVLWIPISQYSYQALTTASFEHVHSLSLDFHLGKRTGEVLSALSKGNSINNFLEQITFQVLPMLLDLVFAVFYFAIVFDAYYALTVIAITSGYLYLTIRMAQWRSKQRREMNDLNREEDAVKNDSLTAYETVKYFNAEDYEFNRYRNAVTAFQEMEYKVVISLNILNICQNMVFMIGLLITSFLVAYQITSGTRSAADFMVLMTYMAQLQAPLNFFGQFYRGIQAAMISGERLLELFKEKPTVVDEPGAVEMPSCEGEIIFHDVKFSYDKRKPALQNLSFRCAPGTTTAFVGESGGGKSTVFRLLFRFYNTQDGSIQIDGSDIRSLTIDSVRSHIGVVPQDTILFNESIMYNLRYANQEATDEEIFDACRAASIHDKIMAFPDGYNTKVGERGTRLSGGEKQRVAIARTIVKNPRIIMLDEATAALDSTTEENIQNALSTLSKGRTMLVIAHRLSTITNADQILVLDSGRVAEAGTHHELLEMKGRYADLWKKQIRAEKAAVDAAEMVAKAQALQKISMGRPDSSGHGGISEDVSENEADSPNDRSLTTMASKHAVDIESNDADSTIFGDNTLEDCSVNSDTQPEVWSGDSRNGQPDPATSTTGDPATRSGEVPLSRTVP